MGQEATAETLPSWIGFLGGPCLQPVLNGSPSLSADAELGDQCLPVSLQEPLCLGQERMKPRTGEGGGGQTGTGWVVGGGGGGKRVF